MLKGFCYPHHSMSLMGSARGLIVMKGGGHDLLKN